MPTRVRAPAGPPCPPSPPTLRNQSARSRGKRKGTSRGPPSDCLRVPHPFHDLRGLGQEPPPFVQIQLPFSADYHGIPALRGCLRRRCRNAVPSMTGMARSRRTTDGSASSRAASASSPLSRGPDLETDILQVLSDPALGVRIILHNQDVLPLARGQVSPEDPHQVSPSHRFGEVVHGARGGSPGHRTPPRPIQLPRGRPGARDRP